MYMCTIDANDESMVVENCLDVVNEGMNQTADILCSAASHLIYPKLFLIIGLIGWVNL